MSSLRRYPTYRDLRLRIPTEEKMRQYLLEHGWVRADDERAEFYQNTTADTELGRRLKHMLSAAFFEALRLNFNKQFVA